MGGHPRSSLIGTDVAARVLSRALVHGGDFAEVFAERTAGLTMAIDESRVESVQAGGGEGAGVRVASGGTTYFAHVDGLDLVDLERAASEAAAALRSGEVAPRQLTQAKSSPHSIEQPPEQVPTGRKADLLRACSRLTTCVRSIRS